MIHFNGAGPSGFETFCFPLIHETRDGEKPDAEGRYFERCKTAYRRYDLIVMSCLVVMKSRLGDMIIVSSDEEDQDWECARDLCGKVLKYGSALRILEGVLVDLTKGPDFGLGEESAASPQNEA
jgi:hypothetical protein